MFTRMKEVCAACDGAGRVVDEQQAGEPVATCMVCRGNGWVYADQNEPLSKNQGSNPPVTPREPASPNSR